MSTGTVQCTNTFDEMKRGITFEIGKDIYPHDTKK